MSDFPDGWTKTVEDLFKGVSTTHRVVPPEEISWALAYERSRWPSGLRIPQAGDEYEALEDIGLFITTHWRTAFTGGVHSVVKKGTRVAVIYPLAEGAVGVATGPVDYDRLELELIPEADRRHPKYDGYSISIKVLTLHQQFRLVRSSDEQR